MGREGYSPMTPNTKKEMRIPRVLLTLSLPFMVFCASLLALDEPRTMQHFVHARWTQQEGMPDVNSLDQTADGYLWVSTPQGLLRFDGVRFERYVPPSGQKLLSNNIRLVKAMPDGGLWVAYAFGGLSLIKDGRLTNYSESEGMPSGSTYAIAKDGEGCMWAATTRGLMRLEGSHWNKVQSDWKFPENHATNLFSDNRGTLWVITEKKLMFLPRGARSFSQTSVSVKGLPMMAQAPDGTLWLNNGGVIRRLSSTKEGWRLDGPAIKATSWIVIDRNGALWTGNEDVGLLHVTNLSQLREGLVPASSAAIEHYAEKDGLTSNLCWPAIEDFNGDIWVHTLKGLDRFHPAKVNQLHTVQAAAEFNIVADQQGELLYGSEKEPIRQYNGVTSVTKGGPKFTTCAYRDPSGTVWFGGRGSLWRFAENRFVAVDLPAGVTSLNTVQAMTMDPSGRLWVSITRKGVFRLAHGVWEPSGKQPGLPELTAITELTDSGGRIWFGYTGGRVAVLDGERVQVFSTANGVTAGNITALHETHGRVWVGGDDGLDYFSDGSFHPAKAQEDDTLQSVTGIAETSNGDLWLSETSGVVHVQASDVKRVLENPHYRLPYELFNYLDGYLDSPATVRPLPSVIRGAEDRLWFETVSGIFWIDPDHIPRNRTPPPVFIEDVVADGKRYGTPTGLKIPPNVQNLEIDYTALDLSVPERVRFRYRLEGADSNWVDVQTRRQAYYTKLRPGKYTFHVIACNGDGVWNETGAKSAFVIVPAFYQTVWWKVLLGFIALGLIWLIHSLRLRQATAQMQARLGERLEERGRIARELHDTLIQSVDGLMLRLQTGLDEPDQKRSHQMIEKALDSADEVMAEGRQRVQSLRAEAITVTELSAALAAYGNELAEIHRIAFSIALIGPPKPVDTFVRDEAYRIGREALGNAFQHSGAASIEAEITYDRALLRVRVRDDGLGMDPQVIDEGKPGHYGLTGMRERAQTVGGRLVIWSRSGAGTEIDLEIPARIAYQNGFRGFNLYRRKRAMGHKEERQ